MPWLNQLDKRLAVKALVQEKQHYLVRYTAVLVGEVLIWNIVCFLRSTHRYVVFHELKQGHYQLLPILL